MRLGMVPILRRHIFAEGAGIWELQETENMLAYSVSAGYHKYVSCLFDYLDAMKTLPDAAQITDEAFKARKFSMDQVSGEFSGVWWAMASEQTYICEAKNQLFHVVAQQRLKLDKYLKAFPIMVTVSEQVKSMVHTNDYITTSSQDIATIDADLFKEIVAVIDTEND